MPVVSAMRVACGSTHPGHNTWLGMGLLYWYIAATSCGHESSSDDANS